MKTIDIPQKNLNTHFAMSISSRYISVANNVGPYRLVIA